MDVFVLIPEQLSLELLPGEEIRVVSNQSSLPRGLRFSPFQGTLRTDDELNLKNIPPHLGRVRATSWVRFLRESVRMTKEVNLVELILGNGQVVYELTKGVERWEELVLFSTEPPLAFTKALKEAIFEETMKALILEVPLDLSTSLLHKSKSVVSWDEGESDECSISPPLISSETSSLKSSCPVGRKRTRALLPCSVCGKAFDRPSLLKRHMRTHTGEKPHVCSVCGKGFSTSSSLNTHQRIHSGEKPHECPICSKRFTASSNLYYHRMTHVKEKPHKCSICSKSFPTPGDLKSHGYVHSGSWPFRCPVCKRGFSKQTNLKNHLFLHTGSKPHSCSVCFKKFALACNLRAHLKTHDEMISSGEMESTSPAEEEEEEEEEEIEN